MADIEQDAQRPLQLQFGCYWGMADIEQDAQRPLQLQPRNLTKQIFLKGAVARSPHKVAPSGGPCRPIAEGPPSFDGHRSLAFSPYFKNRLLRAGHGFSRTNYVI
jgi:hypothetical protein